MPNPIDRLAELFEHFPGIGPRQARRFVQYLLGVSESTRKELVETIRKLGADAKSCTQCFRWYMFDGKIKNLCTVCANPKRDGSTLFVIEKDIDIGAVEGSGYRGLYFVLGGTIPLAAEAPEKHIRLKELLKRMEEKRLQEIILGLSATAEGDHTRQILYEKIRSLAEKRDIKLSSLGRGLSTGSELEYADPDTITSALSSRA